MDSKPGEIRELNSLADLKIKVFADGADLREMYELYRNPLISGFTTNPTLMRKSGVCDYQAFAKEVLAAIPDRPISFEVLSDDFSEMEQEALVIAGWGENVYVKIPITSTLGESSAPLIRRLSSRGVKVNVTALLTLDQVREACYAMRDCRAGYISVFAGRIADTGRDPVPIMSKAREILSKNPNLELIWASPRELLNLFQADAIGCQIITMTEGILSKLSLIGKDLDEYSLETVKMFRKDALAAMLSIHATV
ncbi:MAG TPA: transaldolase [Bryobacteraceae bacterium]|jgi:transaldolase